MNDKDRVMALTELLGEENTNKIKEKVADFIIEAMRDDINGYNRENYILDPDDIINFVNECKREAFERIKEEVVNQMMEKIKEFVTWLSEKEK